jgi:hypothetical protein
MAMQCNVILRVVIMTTVEDESEALQEINDMQMVQIQPPLTALVSSSSHNSTIVGANSITKLKHISLCHKR